MLYNEPIENIYDIINEGKVIKQNNKIKFKDKRLNYQFFVTKSNKNDTLTVIYIKDGRNFTDTILEVGNKFVIMNKFKINDDYDMWR
jgi:predicted alpha/beta superfamily hydrolase